MRIIAILFLFLLDVMSLQRVLDIQRTFIRYVSHEMRTPLNSACMGLELLHDSSAITKKDASAAVVLEDVVHSCDSAVSILDELLIFEKLESKSLVLNLKRVSPHVFLKEVFEPSAGQVSDGSEAHVMCQSISLASFPRGLGSRVQKLVPVHH